MTVGVEVRSICTPKRWFSGPRNRLYWVAKDSGVCAGLSLGDGDLFGRCFLDGIAWPSLLLLAVQIVVARICGSGSSSFGPYLFPRASRVDEPLRDLNPGGDPVSNRGAGIHFGPAQISCAIPGNGRDSAFAQNCPARCPDPMAGPGRTQSTAHAFGGAGPMANSNGLRDRGLEKALRGSNSTMAGSRGAARSTLFAGWIFFRESG